MLPENINPGVHDPLPTGIFLVPLCTTREAVIEMVYALDTAYKMSGKLIIIKDFLNALAYIDDPYSSLCLTEGESPEPPDIVIETDGDCQRVLIDGIAVTDWICPDDPENPPLNPPQVGKLGYTIEELEGFIMGCLDISGSIRMGANGLIEVRTCDGWETLAGQTAPLQTSAQSSIADGINYAQWVAAGQPPLPALASVPHENPDYNTGGSVQCAKATALVNTLKHLLTGIRDNLEDVNDDTLDFEGVVAAIGAGYVIGNLPGAFAVAALIFGAKNTAPELIGQIDGDLADAALWDDVICETVELMNEGTRVETDDIDHIITNWQERDTVSELAKQILYAYPVSTWKAYSQQRVSATDCGCGAYLPAGVNPPLPAGAMRYDFAEFGYASPAVLFPVAGSPYPAIYADGRRGDPFGSVWATELTDVSGGYEGGFLMAVFQFTAPVTISQISALFTFPDGTPSNDVQFGMAHFSTDNGGEWEDGVGWGTINDFPEVFASAKEITAFAIAARGANLGTFRRVVLAQVLCSGTFLGEPFINLPPGQVFQT